MAPPPLRRRGLSLWTYSIYDGRGFGLTQAIRVVQLHIFDFMLLTKTKITSKAYFHNWLGYVMVCFLEVTTYTGVV